MSDRRAVWTCGYCGSINLPAADCLWCFSTRKLQAAGLRILADLLERADL